MLLLKAVGN